MRLIMITGPAGSGKDTLCLNLKQWAKKARKKMKIIWNGDLVRAYSKTDTYFGKLVKANNEKGKLAAAFVMDMLVGNELKNIKDHPEQIVVWNGTPRTRNDRLILSELMKFMAIVGEVIVLKVTDKECLRRVNIRQKIENRPEFTSSEAIKEKFGSYTQITRPMLCKLEGSPWFRVHWIDGEWHSDDVFKNVLRALELT